VTTVEIRQRVRDNLNRDDAGIDVRIQGWINDARRLIERARNFDYMRAAETLTVAAPAQEAPLPARFKGPVAVHYRQTAPAGEVGLSWVPLPRLSESEVLRLEGFETATAPVTGAPRGHSLTETAIRLHPTPPSGRSFAVRLTFWRFSADWTFAPDESPYLARFAWPELIARATALGFAMLGEVQDAQVWEVRAATEGGQFLANEMARALEGEIEMRPMTGAQHPRPSRPPSGWGRI
jgi:hypothetical protein